MKPIPDFPEYYATADGCIFSCRKSKQLGSALRKLALSKNKSTGYWQCNFYNNAGSKRKDIHRIIATLFCPDSPDAGEYVNHIDGNKDNNHSTNLEWCTHTENMKHAWGSGLMENARGRLSKEQVIEMRHDRYVYGITYAELGARFEVSGGEARRVCIGEHYKDIEMPSI